MESEGTLGFRENHSIKLLQGDLSLLTVHQTTFYLTVFNAIARTSTRTTLPPLAALLSTREKNID